MKHIISISLITILLVFDLLEPLFRSKGLYFSIKINQRKGKLEKVYKNYLKKVMLITLPIGIFLLYYYPIEENFLSFLFGFLVMIFLNLFFYFVARKEIKEFYRKNN